MKVEKMDEAEKEGEEGKHASEEQKVEIKKEDEDEDEVTKNGARDDTAACCVAKLDPAMGRLVMTIEGHQKQLSFSSSDLLSTATMLHGDKVRP